MLDQTRCAMPPSNPHRQEARSNRPVRYRVESDFQEGVMGMVMVKCPQTGHAIPTGIETDRESFRRSAVFFSRTRCPICRADHAWFAPEAWVDEPRIRVRRRAADTLA